MEGFWFSHGERFMMNDTEYIVREEKDRDIVIEDIRYNQIKTVSINDLLTEWSNGTLQFPSDEQERKSIHDDIEQYSPEELREIKKRFAIIEPFTFGKKRECSVEEYLAKLPPPKPSRATFYRWLNRYNSHNDKRYLSPRYDQRGPRERRPDSRVLEMLVEILNSDDDRGFYSGTDIPIYSIFTTLANRVKTANREREPKDKLRMISKDTVYRIVHEIVDMYKKNKARHGRSAAELKKHGVTTNVLSANPLERVEVDWTPLHMFTVDTGTRKRERPYLVYAIDKCTSCPLGFHIAFKEPTAVDVKQCLLHAMLPKTYVKQYYPEVKHDWDAWGKPQEIIVDNAKVFESMDLEDVLELCEIDMQFCHVQTPNQKGTVERGLQTINSIIAQMPGSVFSNPQERSRYDSEGRATVTIIGLYRIIHVLLVDLIAHSIHHDYGMTPHQMWVQKHQAAKVRRTLPYSKQTLKLLFGSLIKSRSIQNKGVEIKGQCYQSDALQELRQRLANKSGVEHPKVRIRFDLDDMREVYVYDPDYERYITARATINSLEKKGIDERYPVHFQQLADYSLSVSRGIHDFDVTELADADDIIYKIIQNDRALLRGVSRLAPNQIEETSNVPVVSLVSLQLDSDTLDTVPDLNTLGRIALADSDSEASKKSTNEQETITGTNLVNASGTDNKTEGKENGSGHPSPQSGEQGDSTAPVDDNADARSKDPTQNQTKESHRLDENEDEFEVFYLVPQRGN